MLLGDPLDALDDISVRAEARRPQHFDGDETGFLGHAKGLAADRPGAMGSVAVAINVEVEEGDRFSPALAG